MNNKKILFVIDELEYKWFENNKLVTNFWFIKEFLKRNIDVEITTKCSLFIENAQAFALCNTAQIREDDEIFYKKQVSKMLIENFDAVFFRPDPPVDITYINACNVFEYVDTAKTKLVNNPLAIRNFSEKIQVNKFPQFAPSNIVTCSKELILEFVNKYGKAVIKPLNKCFGSGVFLLAQGDANISSIIAAATENGKTPVMVQEYLIGAVNGDKRVLIIGDEVMPECVRKLPAPNDFKFAEHSDKYFEKATLTQEEIAVATNIAKQLYEQGLPLVGLDMIDGKIIEINVTSPCYFINEINTLFQIKFEEKIMPKVLSLIGIQEKEQLAVM